MNYFNLIFSNKSILRIFQKEIFKEFKIEGDVIEFGASSEIHKNFFVILVQKIVILLTRILILRIKNFLTLIYKKITPLIQDMILS